MDRTTKIIMYESDEAAKFITEVSGWVDSKGYFHGSHEDSEERARYCGCTHRLCECGNIMEKTYTKCESCRGKIAQEKYNSLEQKEWDETGYLYSETHNMFFNSWEDVDDYLIYAEDRISIDDLRLVICEPVYLRHVPEDFWADDLPEEVSLDKVWKALNEFNQILQDVGPVSYQPGIIRPIIEAKHD